MRLLALRQFRSTGIIVVYRQFRSCSVKTIFAHASPTPLSSPSSLPSTTSSATTTSCSPPYSSLITSSSFTTSILSPSYTMLVPKDASYRSEFYDQPPFKLSGYVQKFASHLDAWRSQTFVQVIVR